MNARILQTGLASLVVALVLGGGCTEPPLGWDGSGRLQALPPPATDASALVDAETGVANLPGLCIPNGVICHDNHDCCNGTCSSSGECLPAIGTGGPVCAPDGVVCQHSSDCCDGYCGMGVCGATPSPGCAPEGVRCHVTTDCCNAASDGGPGVVCNPVAGGSVCGGTVTPSTPPLCVPYGIICEQKSDCCVGDCTLNSSLTLVCDIPPP